MTLFRRSSLILLLGFGIGQAGCDRAKPFFESCVDLEQNGNLGGAQGACENAVAADPDSKSGRGAAEKLKAIEFVIAKRKADDERQQAETAQKATSALIAKYRGLSPEGQREAMRRCFDSSPCSDEEKNAIIAAADPAEQAALTAIIDQLTPTKVNFDQLKKLAGTGMTLGKPYKICAYYYPNDIPQFCKYNGKYCEVYLPVEDNFAVGSNEKKALYDRRDKSGCFEVRMFHGGDLRITALL